MHGKTVLLKYLKIKRDTDLKMYIIIILLKIKNFVENFFVKIII